MSDKIKSLIFDFFQVGSQAFLYLSGPIIASSSVLIFLQLLALFILFEAAWEMRRTKYYRVPDVGKQNELVTGGIYAYVRNPMYVAQLLFSGVLLMSVFSALRFIAYLVLIINFVFKIQYEERLLNMHFKEFKEYRRKSWRLLPFIYCL